MRSDPSLPQGHIVSPVQPEIVPRHQPQDISASREYSQMFHPSPVGQEQYGAVGWSGSGVEQHGIQQVLRSTPAESVHGAEISSHLSRWGGKDGSTTGALYQHHQQGTQPNSYHHTHPSSYHQSGFAHVNTGTNMSGVSATSDSGNQMAQPVFSGNDQSYVVNAHGGDPTGMKHPDSSSAHWKSSRTGDGGYTGHTHHYNMGYEGVQNSRGSIVHADGQVQQYPGDQAALTATGSHASRMPLQQEYIQGSQHGLQAHQVQPVMDYHQGHQAAPLAGPHYPDPGMTDSGAAGSMYLQHKGYLGGSEQQASLDPYSRQKTQHQHNQSHQGYTPPNASQAQANPAGNSSMHPHMQSGEGYGQAPAVQTYGHGNHQATNLSAMAPNYQSVVQAGLQPAEGSQSYSQYQYTQGDTLQTQGNAYAGYDYSQYAQTPYPQGNQSWSGYLGYDPNAYVGSGPQ